MEASTYGATPQDVDVSRAGGLSSRSSTSRVFSGAVVATVAAVALITLVYMTNFGVYSMFGGAHVTDEPVTFVLHTCDIPDFVSAPNSPTPSRRVACPWETLDSTKLPLQNWFSLLSSHI